MFHSQYEIMLASMEFSEMQSYLQLMDSTLDQRFDEIESKFRGEFDQEMSEDEAERMRDHYTNKIFETGRRFPQRILSSFIVAWYSLIEQKLIDLCENLDLKMYIRPKGKENYGKGIRRARRFLLEAKGYEIHTPHWNELVAIGRLRNFIVHSGTKIMGDFFPSEENSVLLESEDRGKGYFSINDNLLDYLERHDLFQHSGIFIYIEPTFEYCKYLINFGEELLFKLYNDFDQ